MRRLIAGLGIILLVGVGVASAGAAPSGASREPSAGTRTLRTDSLASTPEQATIVLYGDSLASEARFHFYDALLAAGVTNVRLSTYGGTAICDWLDQMRADAVLLRPTAVVVEFSGNALTECMADASGQSLAATPEAYHRKYLEDASQVLEIFEPAGTTVYFAGAPRSRRAEESDDPDADRLNQLYATLAARSDHGRYVDAGAAVLRQHHWTETLPCLEAEPCSGGTDAQGRAVNVVRAPDGGHFCPGAPDALRGVTDDCPVWSSGAYRYGVAMAVPVIRDVGASSDPGRIRPASTT